MEIFEVATRWGSQPARYPYLTQPDESSTLAVLFPGRNYALDAPLMWYVRKAVYEAGCDVLGVEYGYQSNHADFTIDDLDALVDEVGDGLIRCIPRQYTKVVLIGKSIGTIIQSKVQSKPQSTAPFSADNHIFLTPLRPVIPFIQDKRNSLVIVGDSDPLFGADDIAPLQGRSNVHVHVMQGADHLLEVPDTVLSIDILSRTASLCHDFCSSLLQ